MVHAMKRIQKQRSDLEAEAQRRIQQVLSDEDAMRGIQESLKEVKKGERGMRLSELKQKRPRARRVSS